jgi:hypothetical protein
MSRRSFVALAALHAVALAHPALAQGPVVLEPAVRVPAAPQKDPVVGTLLSFLITGGGQMYAGKVGKGVGLMGLSIGSMAVGVGMASNSCNSSRYGTTCDVTPVYVATGVAVGTWLYSLITASSDVRAYNLAHADQTAGPVYVATAYRESSPAAPAPVVTAPTASGPTAPRVPVRQVANEPAAPMTAASVATATVGAPASEAARLAAAAAFRQGNVHLDRHEWTKAEQAYKLALGHDGSVAAYHAALGWLMISLQRWSDAEAAYSAAVLLDVDNAEYRARLKEARSRR